MDGLFRIFGSAVGPSTEHLGDGITESWINRFSRLVGHHLISSKRNSTSEQG
jgi:TolB-like protein